MIRAAIVDLEIDLALVNEASASGRHPAARDLLAGRTAVMLEEHGVLFARRSAGVIISQ